MRIEEEPSMGAARAALEKHGPWKIPDSAQAWSDESPEFRHVAEYLARDVGDSQKMAAELRKYLESYHPDDHPRVLQHIIAASKQQDPKWSKDVLGSWEWRRGLPSPQLVERNGRVELVSRQEWTPPLLHPPSQREDRDVNKPHDEGGPLGGTLPSLKDWEREYFRTHTAAQVGQAVIDNPEIYTPKTIPSKSLTTVASEVLENWKENFRRVYDRKRPTVESLAGQAYRPTSRFRAQDPTLDEGGE